MFHSILRLSNCILLYFCYVQTFPINDLRADQLPKLNEKIIYRGILSRRIVKRSVSNGFELLKIFTENSRKYHCQITLKVGNSSYINQRFFIQDDVSKLSITNVQTNSNGTNLNSTLLSTQFFYTGNQNLTLSYDFVPSDMSGTEYRIVTVLTSATTTFMTEFACLQRGSFNDSILTNSALIVALFVALIIAVIVFLILWFLFCHQSTDEVDTVTETNEKAYIIELNLLTEESNNTASKTKSNITNVAIEEQNIFEFDLSNARNMDEQLQTDAGKLNDIFITIWVNRIVQQFPNLKEKLGNIIKQRNNDRDALQRTYQNKVAEAFKQIKNEIIHVNNVNLDHLQISQKKERERIMAMVTSSDVDDVTENLNNIFENEKRNVATQLKLKQEEAFEEAKLKLQSEMMAEINANEMGHVKTLIKDPELNPDDCDEIIKRYVTWQQRLQSVAENERIRQAASLALLLERRRNQDKMKEEEKKNVNELLEQKMKYFVNKITELEENEDISEEVSSKILSQFEEHRQHIIEDMEKSKKSQIGILAERLNEAKRKRIEDLKTKQNNELNNLLTVHKSDTDVESVINDLDQLRCEHRDELKDVETKIDDQNSADIADLQRDIGMQTLDKLDDKITDLCSVLKYSGFSESDIEDILNDSRGRMKKIQEMQQKERKKQEKNLEERLRHKKEDIEENAIHQCKDQMKALESQHGVMNEITNMQKTLSDEERHRMLELSARNRTSMENNLVNTCLLQKRKMTEALNAKKNEKRKKLEQAHEEDIYNISAKASNKKSQQSIDNSISKCMSDYVAERLKITNDGDSQNELDKEMEQSRREMLDERNLLIRRKEEEIAALLNKIQIAKAALHIELKERQGKLKELQIVVLDTVNKDKSISTVITKHNEEKETLIGSIEMNKKRQEDELQKRLQKKKKKTLLPDEGEGPEHKESEEMTRRKKQNLENDIMKINLKSENDIKQFETEFLQKIMESGNYRRSEMLALLRQQFPQKTNREIEIMADEIQPKLKENAQPPKSLIESYQKITDIETMQSSLPPVKGDRPFSAISQRPDRIQTLPVNGYLPTPISRPGTSGTQSRHKEQTPQQAYPMDYDIRREDTPEDMPNEDVQIVKPKKKKKRLRKREENLEDEGDEMF